jgi:hypothetical protein
VHDASKTQQRGHLAAVTSEHWDVLRRAFDLHAGDKLVFRALQLRGRLVRLVRLGRRWM